MSPPSTLPEAVLPEFLQAADVALRRIGKPAQNVAWTLIDNVRDNGSGIAAIDSLKMEAGIEGDALERLLLFYAAQEALPRVASLPIDDWVRVRLEQDLQQLHAMLPSLTAGAYHFDRAARMATLRRFPAGPMEWEPGGIPRSWYLKAAFPDNLRMLAFVTRHLGASKPVMFMHVAPAPRNRGLVLPRQVLRSYYHMARAMTLQPQMLALVAHAWFHDPAAVRDHPHLHALNEPYLNHGGLIVTLGSAPPSSGVTDGNAERKTKYLTGKMQYRYGLAIWPREAVIRWAEAHPDLAG